MLASLSLIQLFASLPGMQGVSMMALVEVWTVAVVLYSPFVKLHKLPLEMPVQVSNTGMQ